MAIVPRGERARDAAGARLRRLLSAATARSRLASDPIVVVVVTWQLCSFYLYALEARSRWCGTVDDAIRCVSLLLFFSLLLLFFPGSSCWGRSEVGAGVVGPRLVFPLAVRLFSGAAGLACVRVIRPGGARARASLLRSLFSCSSFPGSAPAPARLVFSFLEGLNHKGNK